MTRLERFRERLAKLEEKRCGLLRSGRYTEAVCLTEDIKKVEEMIREAEDYEEATKPKPAKELLNEEEISRIVPLMIECHLVADFLTETAYMIVDQLKEFGISGVRFMPELTELLEKSEKFAGAMAKMNTELCDLIVNNETFNASLHKKYLKYIGQRLK